LERGRVQFDPQRLDGLISSSAMSHTSILLGAASSRSGIQIDDT
jgi:hypothetical protein